MQHRQRPSMGNFCFRIRNLPPEYARWARRGSADTLQMIIAHTLGIHTHNVETGRGWASKDGRHAWAFLAVGSEPEGTTLIKRIGQIHCMKLDAQWRHANEPALLARSDIVELAASFPGHCGFFHARYGLWREENVHTDE